MTIVLKTELPFWHTGIQMMYLLRMTYEYIHPINPIMYHNHPHYSLALGPISVT